MVENVDKFVKFVCPECGDKRIECCMDGPHTCLVDDIHTSGDFNYGDYESTADLDRYQCVACGFVIPENDNVDVAQWCLENCPQE